MKERELELMITCSDCGHHFKYFREMLVWHMPRQLVKELKMKQKPHMKCPNCRNNNFIIRVTRDKYGEYEV